MMRPMSGDVGELVQAGRLAGVLCRLARERFTGVVYAERGDDVGAVFSFRHGHVVFVEDLGGEQSIPDMLMERGFITKEQYARIATRVVDSLAENEDVAFCEQAVELRILSQAQIDTELERMVRGRVIQATAWDGCRIELDPDPDALAGIPELPQAVGPLIHTGVRTFYDDERVRATLRHEGDLYVRLTCSVAEAAELFSLDPEERALLARLRPDVPFARVLEDCDAEPLEAWQLLCTLAMAGLTELGSAPLSNAERSGVRSTESMTGRQGLQGGVREERAGLGSQSRMPSVQPAPARASQGRMPAANPPRQAVARPVAAPTRPLRPERGTGYSSSRMEAIAEEQISRTSASTAMRAPVAARAPEAPSAPRAQPVDQVVAPPKAQPVAEPAPRAAPRERRRPRKLSVALKRLDRELKQLRPAPAAALAAAPQPTPPPATAQSQGKAHLEQLMRMRRATLSQRQPTPSGQPATERSASDLFRSAQEAMREQQFPRAHEIMLKVLEAAPNDENYAMYGMWASLRAGLLGEEGISKLRLALRERVSDDQQKAFAYYALGHIAIHEKKDDAAEKFFRKAVEFDKHNKDAERHLRVIELRRKTAAETSKGNKIFGIEIKKKSD
jgi:hypothetical protein